MHKFLTHLLFSILLLVILWMAVSFTHPMIASGLSASFKAVPGEWQVVSLAFFAIFLVIIGGSLLGNVALAVLCAWFAPDVFDVLNFPPLNEAAWQFSKTVSGGEAGPEAAETYMATKHAITFFVYVLLIMCLAMLYRHVRKRHAK